MMWGDWGMGWGWGIFGALHMLLWWVLIILGIVVLVKWLAGGSSRREHASGDGALEILKARYAKGEISREQFDQIKRDLKG